MTSLRLVSRLAHSQEFIGEQPAGLVADFVGGCLSSVNWTEIASHHTDEAIRNEQEQTANAEA